MSKFKVIEKSRFLNDEEMSKVKGGEIEIVTPMCTPQRPFSSLCTFTHTTCAPAVAQTGYGTFNCNRIGGYHFCMQDMTFTTTFCSNLSPYTTKCPGGQNYA